MSKKEKVKKHRVVFFMETDKYNRFKSALALKGLSVSGFLRNEAVNYTEKNENFSRQAS